jgi:hypothetical protein
MVSFTGITLQILGVFFITTEFTRFTLYCVWYWFLNHLQNTEYYWRLFHLPDATLIGRATGVTDRLWTLTPPRQLINPLLYSGVNVNSSLIMTLYAARWLHICIQIEMEIILLCEWRGLSWNRCPYVIVIIWKSITEMLDAWQWMSFFRCHSRQDQDSNSHHSICDWKLSILKIILQWSIYPCLERCVW